MTHPTSPDPRDPGVLAHQIVRLLMDATPGPTEALRELVYATRSLCCLVAREYAASDQTDGHRETDEVARFIERLRHTEVMLVADPHDPDPVRLQVIATPPH